MIEWGQNSKPQKIPGSKINPPPKKNPMLNFQALKISRKLSNSDITQKIKTLEKSIYSTMGPGFACTTRNLQIVLNTPRNLYLKQATQKNPGIKNFKLKKIVRSSVSLEVQSTSPGHLVYNDLCPSGLNQKSKQ